MSTIHAQTSNLPNLSALPDILNDHGELVLETYENTRLTEKLIVLDMREEFDQIVVKVEDETNGHTWLFYDQEADGDLDYFTYSMPKTLENKKGIEVIKVFKQEDESLMGQRDFQFGVLSMILLDWKRRDDALNDQIDFMNRFAYAESVLEDKLKLIIDGLNQGHKYRAPSALEKRT